MIMKTTTNPNETIAFNAVVDWKDTSLHDVDTSASDEEVSYEEIEENYNLMYTKWIDFYWDKQGAEEKSTRSLG